MKASKFSEAQKAFILKQGADGVPVAEICRKSGISQATYFTWKQKYDGMTPPEMRRPSCFRTRWQLGRDEREWRSRPTVRNCAHVVR